MDLSFYGLTNFCFKFNFVFEKKYDFFSKFRVRYFNFLNQLK